VSATNQLLSNNQAYVAAFAEAELPAPPALRIAIVTCMDARIDPARTLGLEPGDAHVIRNAGGVVTADVLRSLSISQHELGTQEIAVVGHTKCGLMTFTDDEYARKRELSTGFRPPWAAGAFADIESSVRESVRIVLDCPFVPHRESVRGFVYEIETGRVREVQSSG
jgi:carbonic anhydrase